MSETPFSLAESLRIGAVDFVSPDEIRVLLDIEAPDSVALNTGGARPFPRINGYVLVPIDDGFVVGQIEWLTIERSSFPKRRGVKDFGVIDLPYPLRKLCLNPLGTLRQTDTSYSFRRGAGLLPTVGSAVVLPTTEQLRSIVESGENRRVRIGVSPLAENAEVSIDPDRLFGRHLAVLGNTGSGKSCTVAGLIRWSLEAAKRERESNGTTGRPNARFVILDPNGEYARAFHNEKEKNTARVFKLDPGDSEHPLHVPLWFWNSAEWSSFTQATAKTQRPMLRRALRDVKAGRGLTDGDTYEEKKLGLRRYLTSVAIGVRRRLSTGEIRDDPTKTGFWLKSACEDLSAKTIDFDDVPLSEITKCIKSALDKSFSSFPKDGETIEYYKPFSENDVRLIVAAMDGALDCLGGLLYEDGPDEDMPIRFKGIELADHLQLIAAQENASQFVDFLVSRIRTFLSDSRCNSIVEGDNSPTLQQWLETYVGSENEDESPISILDLSLVPTEIVHVVIAVCSRMIFESLQRYRKIHKKALPTVLVMEEAHTFIKRYKDDVDNHDAAKVCCQVFERIAREGRKFGLGLVLSSQRPSELSQTVLSQCNTFVMHRISNDRDQELVKKLVPDNLRGLLRELPSLPSQHAIILGWATEFPLLVRIDDLKKEQQPHSDDPDFWDVWTGQDDCNEPVDRPANWDSVVHDWQGVVKKITDDGTGEDAQSVDPDDAPF
ncbi:AAA-like domain protein [Novipirellula aureliae]|uniref:AAA-like domain protein n=1 Tax=Novipirellula aureliae TaxID=2527966 RepID=A0A5C6DL69_9BACT|nr:ATP-binding protein [Novipirellula aureliae]TWU35649.1 AAA-like domain protein [Novipirellula aureliae]